MGHRHRLPTREAAAGAAVTFATRLAHSLDPDEAAARHDSSGARPSANADSVWGLALSGNGDERERERMRERERERERGVL